MRDRGLHGRACASSRPWKPHPWATAALVAHKVGSYGHAESARPYTTNRRGRGR